MRLSVHRVAAVPAKMTLTEERHGNVLVFFVVMA